VIEGHWALGHVGFFLARGTRFSRPGMTGEILSVPYFEVMPMKRELFLMTAVTLAAAGTTFFLSACDRTLETTSKVTRGPDGTSVKTETTVQHPDGSVTVDKESHSTTPN
jgi:hypothetical protein